MAICFSGFLRSRYFAYWQEFQKEAARAKAIQDEFIRQAEAKAKEGQKAADILSDGVIVGSSWCRLDSTRTRTIQVNTIFQMIYSLT
ncbi:hypothetical protein FB446DRAFT_716345 [Lentinula raphanica]|nr:hypothetical protein FB446DRAFT_716345 [Lentinula raphanica]